MEATAVIRQFTWEKSSHTQRFFLNKSLNFHNNCLFSVTSPNYWVVLNVTSLFGWCSFLVPNKISSLLYSTHHILAEMHVFISSKLENGQKKYTSFEIIVFATLHVGKNWISLIYGIHMALQE